MRRPTRCLKGQTIAVTRMLPGRVRIAGEDRERVSAVAPGRSDSCAWPIVEVLAHCRRRTRSRRLYPVYFYSSSSNVLCRLEETSKANNQNLHPML